MTYLKFIFPLLLLSSSFLHGSEGSSETKQTKKSDTDANKQDNKKITHWLDSMRCEDPTEHDLVLEALKRKLFPEETIFHELNQIMKSPDWQEALTDILEGHEDFITKEQIDMFSTRLTPAERAVGLFLLEEVAALERFLEKEKPDLNQPVHNAMPLSWCLTLDHTDYLIAVSTLLIKYGARLDAKEEYDNTPIHHLFTREDAYLIYQELPKETINLSIENTDKLTSVDIAIFYLQTELLKELAEQGTFDPTAINGQGNTIFHHLTKQIKTLEIEDLLIETDDQEEINKKQAYRKKLTKELVPFFIFLLERGIDPSRVNDEGESIITMPYYEVLYKTALEEAQLKLQEK